ncbi:MAG TPA: nitrilase-related carbon-nitrogen hydrolase [Candidatus Polarisedimenticolaceae bacterium]|nr:nitrilase-related carbon-nitrogen hydrolase [Candidatus Polarisedimenticolaceae bacterium]
MSLAQIAPRLGDVGANLALHLEIARRAKREGARLVVFPELSLTGYVLRDLVPEVALAADAPAWRRLEQASRTIDLLVGFVEDAPGHRYYNAAAYLSRGRRVHLHRKAYLPTYGLFQEGRDLAAGDRIRSFAAPFGPAGVLICEDVWHPSSAWLLAQEGAETIFIPSNGPTRGTRPGRKITSLGVWEQLVQVTAQFHTTFIVYVNRVGCEDGLTFGGGSLAVDPFGRVLARAPALEEHLLTVELQQEVLRRSRTAYPLLRDENLELVRRELERIRRLRFDLPAEEPAG